MKLSMIKKIDEIEARNDAARCLLGDAITSWDKHKIDAVTTLIRVQRNQIGALEIEWDEYQLTPPVSLDSIEDRATIFAKFPPKLKLIRDTARAIATLIEYVLNESPEAAQFTNSAHTIANCQAEYIREIRDIVGEM